MKRSERGGFRPEFWDMASNPYFLARRSLHEGLREFAHSVQGMVVDLGCGSKPYQELFSGAEKYVGIEIASPYSVATSSAEVLFDGVLIPLRSGCVDCVLSTQTLEHVFEPLAWLSEIHRVLKPGGKLMVTVPLIWGEHEMPVDFGRYTTPGLAHILANAGFQVEMVRRLGGGLTVPLQATAALMAQRTSTWPNLSRRAAYIATLPLLNGLGLLAARSKSDRENPWFLDQLAIARAV